MDFSISKDGFRYKAVLASEAGTDRICGTLKTIAWLVRNRQREAIAKLDDYQDVSDGYECIMADIRAKAMDDGLTWEEVAEW